MLKTLLAGTATASLLALGVQAQQTPDAPETTPPASTEQQLPSVTGEEPAAPVIPDAGTAAAPDATAPDWLHPKRSRKSLPPRRRRTWRPNRRRSPQDSVADAAPAPTIEGWTPVDLATVTPDTLIGKDIRTNDEETVASVEDVVMAADGRIEGIVARYGGLLGFGETRVLLDDEEITVVGDAEQNAMVLTRLTADELKARPEYIPPEG